MVHAVLHLYEHRTFTHDLELKALKMPKEIKEVKEFLNTTRRKDATGVKVKKTNGVTKFKVRCSRFLYTFKVTDPKKAEKIRNSLHPDLKVTNLDAKKAATKNKKK